VGLIKKGGQGLLGEKNYSSVIGGLFPRTSPPQQNPATGPHGNGNSVHCENIQYI